MLSKAPLREPFLLIEGSKIGLACYADCACVSRLDLIRWRMDGGTMTSGKAVLGIIGGSGIYDLPGLSDKRTEMVS